MPAVKVVVVLATVASTAKLLSAANVPPPLRPSPAVSVTPSSVVILVPWLITFAPILSSSFNASANSFNVSNVPGALPTHASIAASTYAVDAA